MTATPALPTGWALEGKILGLHPDHPGPVPLRVYALHEGMEALPDPLRGYSSPDGTFALDITTLLRCSPAPEALAVAVDHPAYLVASAEVPVPARPAPDARGRVVLTCEVQVRPAAVLVVKVVDAAGNPVPEASLGAYRVVDGEPSESPGDRTNSDALGVGRLRVEEGTAWWIAASCAGLAPAAVRSPRGVAGTITLVLREGMAVEGRVTERGLPVEGARLLVFPDAFQGRWLQLDNGKVYFEEGEVRVDDLEVATDAEGRYRASGLVPGSWRVRVEEAGNGRPRVGFERFVEAPAEGIDFEVATGTVLVTVVSGGKPLSGVRLVVGAGGSVPSMETDAEGKAELPIAPGIRYSIQAEKEGFRGAPRHEGIAPKAGETEFVALTMAPLLANGTLVLVLRGPKDEVVPFAGLAFYKDQVRAGGFADETRDLRNPEGKLRVTDVPAGPWKLVVRSGRGFDPDLTWDDPAGTWLDETLTVDVPREGERVVEVPVRQGGRLRIAARNAEGVILTPRCEITDPEGHPMEATFVARYGSGAYQSTVGNLCEKAPSDLAQALPPGKYRIHLSWENGPSQTVEVQLEAGKARTVETTMEGEPPRPRTFVPAEPGK